MKDIHSIKLFQNGLQEWFYENKRDLPWRHTEDPYKIWVSEIILQQTTVLQGLDYYLRIIEKYPTVFAFAKASEEDILKIWQGLGYYSRARNMHKTAQIVATNFNGIFPDNYKDIISLPGIGPYTASAVLSFAYNKPYPVIDGNVLRVVSRIFAIEEPVNTKSGYNLVEEKCHVLFAKHEPANYNQAIMEFGAIHCKVNKPLCSICFIKDYCFANKLNIQHLLPVKTKKKSSRQRFFVYLMPIIIEKGTQYTFIKKREQGDIWTNLYDFILFESNTPFYPKSYKKNAVFNTFINHINPYFDLTSAYTSKLIIHKLTHQNINTYFLVFNSPPFEMPAPFIKIKTGDINKYPLPKLIENFILELKL